ncbi:hypothetical protein Slin15195_G083250 [Septoria linicola]|uniref:Uncharacterized protein n=1 Tax=Septoria linicola TaxID=215465 RepID=A0A9Q9EKP1_9PEZI|nr:hypothetical protein Slin14017_G085760 [Septoria linicola]USW55006.1 hypothetical protein Slin15195_G083250 [Septoria linicola]
MSTANVKQLHWTQRIALVRHNLHTASRSGDFSFFKALQAAGMMEGTNHFATLSATLGDEADTVMAAMDNLNGGMAYIHQDAFLNVYNNLKNAMRDQESQQADKPKLYVDITMQKHMAEMAIDKLCNSAIALINQQPAAMAQDQAAHVFITGVTLIADCVEVVIKQLDSVDQKMDDFIRLEESWNMVKASVIAANAGLKGVYYMLDTHEPCEAPRSLSIASASSSVFRRLSTAFQGSQSPAPSTPTRHSSTASAGAASTPVYRTPTYVRNSVSAGCPTSMPSAINAAAFNANSFNSNNFNNNPFSNSFQAHKLSTIPPTPHSEEHDPFDTADMEDVPPIPELPVELQPGPASVAVS